MKKYEVTFKEEYIYTKVIEVEDSEDIDDAIHEVEPVYALTQDEFEKLNASVYNEYQRKEI